MSQHDKALEQIGGELLKFGLPSLDGAIKGVMRGELFLIAGPPAGGKTLLTTHLVLNNLNRKTIWFTPDESHAFCLAKLFALATAFPGDPEEIVDTKKGRVRVERFAKEHLANLHIYTSEKIKDVEADFIDASRKWGGGPPELFVFDYAGKLQPGYDTTMGNKIDWFKGLIKLYGMYGVVIHQGRKGSISETSDPDLNSLTGAGGPEAFQVLWCRQCPAYTPAEKLKQDLHPAMEVWVLKNKVRFKRPLDPLIFYLRAGGYMHGA